jgi:rRNA pseudouridine-1189 N-methylase Emg1 (Nep1/Mra1 family)
MKYKYVEWIVVTQNRVHCRAIVNMVKKNVRFPQNTRDFLALIKSLFYEIVC